MALDVAECGNGSLLCEMSSCVGTEQTSLPSEKVEKKRKWSEGKFLVLALRVFLGSVFVYASVDKIIDPAAFAEAIYNYRILPGALINFTSIILSWLELLLGVCLIFGIWLHGSLFLGNLLLITFFGALLFNVIRGLDIHCGCFSTTAQGLEGNSVAWYLLRDGFFLVLVGYLFFQVSLRKPRTVDDAPIHHADSP